MNKLYLIGVVIFVFGLGLGFSASRFIPNQISKDIRSNKSSYNFINPLLECENVSFENNNNLISVKKSIEDYVNKSISQGDIINASVYYRDLNNGPWFGVNREDRYSPASLIKVPLLIAVYKTAETDPSIWQKTITIDQDLVYSDQNYKPERTLKKDEIYSIKDLVDRMIVDSDNFAYDLINQNVDSNLLFQVYNDMGIDIQKLNAEDPDGDIISSRDYAGFFRVLYNASYLNRKDSEEALNLLSKSAFEKGLVGGTSGNIVVAHKYGERYYQFSGIHQLHDCGIVYHSKSPYLMCIMTKGWDFEHLQKFIQTVTRMIDENLDKSS